ncbi:MAG: hypothetical protein Q9P90_14215 [candidate division KSB1 bacterium]|nr:hypothetical protein [candidate division KSB1 bacterium]
MMKYRLGVWAILVLVMAVEQTHAQSSTVPSSKFLIKGFGYTTFENSQNATSNFETSFSPIFLWKQGENIFFEGELEVGFNRGGLDFGLEYAQIFYIFNDYAMLGMGKFLNPINYFSERIHPAWINKLPDMPLGISPAGVNLLGGTQLGLQLRGGLPVGNSKMTYTFFLTNGPQLVQPSEHNGNEGTIEISDNNSIMAPMDEGEPIPQAFGLLNFFNSNDNNDDKAVGGRIAYFLTPKFEVGYSYMTAKVGTQGTEFENVRATHHVLDLNYIGDWPTLKGKIDLRAQWVLLNIDNPNIAPLNYENKSSAWYAQFAYQPTNLENNFWRNLEFIVRYDQLDRPDLEEIPMSADMKRISFGIDYWVSPSSMFKFAWQSFSSTHPDGEEEKTSRFITQFALGF